MLNTLKVLLYKFIIDSATDVGLWPVCMRGFVCRQQDDVVRQLIRLRRSQATLEEMRYWLLCRLSQQPDIIGYVAVNTLPVCLISARVIVQVISAGVTV